MSGKVEAILCTVIGFTVGATAMAVAVLKVEPTLWRWIIKRTEKKDV